MGTEAFWVPAAVSAIGTGVTYENNKAANDRQQTAETQNIIQQEQLQNKAASGANALTQQIAKDSPTQIQANATGKYVAQLRKNAAGTTATSSSGDKNLFGQPVSALPTSVNGSSRYQTGTANSQSEVQSYGNTLANELGGMDAPVRERQNEGAAMQGYGTALNGLNLSSWGTNFVNQLRAAAAGQPNPWAALAGGMATGAGGALAKSGYGAPAADDWTAPVANKYWDNAFGGAPIG